MVVTENMNDIVPSKLEKNVVLTCRKTMFRYIVMDLEKYKEIYRNNS